jgi:hypothetical protein
LPDVFELFDEYAARYARGERPEAAEYLDRAGGEAEELAHLIEGFVARTPTPEADDDTATMMRAWVAGEAPLVALRAERGLKRDQVVDVLIERLGLDRAKREKVKRRYHELENGLLDPSGVDPSVWEALATALRARASDLVAWRPRPLAAEAAYLRLDRAAAAPTAAAASTFVAAAARRARR